MKKRANVLLLSFNLILLAVSWVMALYAYARLPEKIPFWVNFFGKETEMNEKSPVFLLYILVQTLLVVVILYFILIRRRRESNGKSSAIRNLQKEFVLLALIFVQLLFIHVQRSLILMAHGVEKGIRPFYFYSVIGILFLLIPLYRMRLKALRKG